MGDHLENASRQPLVGVVEPDADVREFIESLLLRAGYRCESFVSAERFESSARSEHFDCLITDRDLPGIDGLELARRVRASKQPFPVMLLTTDSGVDLQRDAIAAQVMRVQKKPLSVHEFLHGVAQATARVQ
ncbi:MAG: response regulator [Rhodanobacteraceae bacterium]|nr:response regulator [Rhodanobacteraceae bacterium]